MKAINIIKKGEIRLIDKEKPVARQGEVLLKIRYVGFCGSDLNTFLGNNPMVKLPVIPGHEIAATVEQVTEGVPPIIKEGMSCTVNPYTSCGYCSSCRNGRPNACRNNETLGVQRDGAMSDYLVVPWQKVIVGDGMDVRTLALVEPMSVGFHAVSRAAVVDTDTVMVIGCGMVGLGAVVRSALRGACVIAVDVDDEKLSIAKKMGATYVINSRDENVNDRLTKITQDMGTDVIIEAVGSPATYRMAVDEISYTGRIVYIGYAKSEVSFETKYFVSKELDIRGSRNALPEDFRAVMQYFKRNDITNAVISAIFPPEKAEEALTYWAANPGKVFRILIEF
jgi:threonine dehydrogenase-like Zn-dependent dehydrogenase